ncbi:uncharacterized protein G2W53_022925 [Senna tora]|uniref:Uncharacterized protein n=1 Tax=Senna tora TaxID=362788 RepID=A0A834WMK1_9FABA|nr:uncharacterized protein G2W53_022925 [Senna tora]
MVSFFYGLGKIQPEFPLNFRAKSINKSSDRYPLLFLDVTSEHKLIKAGHVISHIRNLLEPKPQSEVDLDALGFFEQFANISWRNLLPLAREDHAPGSSPAHDGGSGDLTGDWPIWRLRFLWCGHFSGSECYQGSPERIETDKTWKIFKQLVFH